MQDTEALLRELLRRGGGVLSVAEARRSGLTEANLRGALRSGVLERLRHGVYTSSSSWEQAGPAAQHLLKILAHQRLHPRSVACEVSAAIALGLPTPIFAPPDQPVVLTPRDPRRQGARGTQAGALRRRAWLRESEVTVLPDGLRVTTLTRTVLDCARAWSFGWGLAIADAAVTRTDLSPQDLIDAARRRPPAPGTGRALRVAEHARAGPESALESLARGVSIDAGLPELTPQVEIRTRLGTFRVDLLDEENGVVLDADGKLKYDAPGALWSEKRREDALRDSGFEVVRFTMSDYHAQPGWIESYRGALARASRRPESAPARQFALAQHSPCVSPGNRRHADGISNIPDGFRG